MKHDEPIDGALLSAFVDGALDGATRAMVIKAMEEDPEVRARVQELRRAKDLMHVGFLDARAPRRDPHKLSAPRRRTQQFAVAASLLVMVVGLAAGYLGYRHGLNQGSEATLFAIAEQARNTRVVLHISQSDPAQFAAALAYVRNFVETQQAQDGEIALVANAGGLDLLRTGVSPYETQIRELMGEFANVHFVACAESIHSLRRSGVEPEFIDNVDTGLPAFEQIIRRVQDGWTYKKVETLPAA